VTLRSPGRLSYVVAIVWVAFTVSLASWWLAVGLNLTRQLASGAPAAEPGADLRRMFIWEGAVFIGLLLAGGVAMVVAIRREHQRRHALETFFMAFTHDLKTAIARVQLQAEGLLEDWPDQIPRAPLERLAADTVRLQTQLENSLFVAQPDGRLLAERLDAAETLARLARDWPDLDVRVEGAATVLADARGFDTIVRNLFQNAVIHGGARHMDVALAGGETGRVRIRMTDDGRGVPASMMARLGEPFTRAGATSGTGVGLFVSRRLASRMGGDLRFPDRGAAGTGFRVELELPGAR
jgi:signal transduction histidine kinase